MNEIIEIIEQVNKTTNTKETQKQLETIINNFVTENFGQMNDVIKFLKLVDVRITQINYSQYNFGTITFFKKWLNNYVSDISDISDIEQNEKIEIEKVKVEEVEETPLEKYNNSILSRMINFAPDTLSMGEVMELLNLSRGTVYKIEKQGTFSRLTRQNEQIQYNAKEVMDYYNYKHPNKRIV